VLGLKEIQRPGLTFPGTWFAIGEHELHIVVKDNLEGDPAFTDDRHIALAVADFDDLPARLEAQNIPFRRGSNPARKQIFFRDPDGNLIELQPGRPGRIDD
jgi:catechol 2,3-dioxygenase-like lactoylglutathione lyase family enzyme